MGVVITGAGSGIGLATAHLLHSQGEAVCIWDINETALRKTSALLDMPFAVVDVTDAEAVHEQMTSTAAQLGGVSAVVHCAAVLHAGYFEQVTPAQHARMIAVNLGGTINIAHAAIPHLKISRGSLVLIASSSSFYGAPEFGTYAATKAAIVRLAEALRLELETDGVHVGVITPHFVDTPMLTESRRAAIYDGAPFTTSADSIAQTIHDMLRSRQNISVPGWRNKLNYWLSRHLPELAPGIVRGLWRRGQRKRT